MIKGFKEFILRGNVIDLAVAVVIGAAFTGIVNILVSAFINPLIGLVFQTGNLNDALVLRVPTLFGGESVFAFGSIIAAVINFLAVATVVYFVFVMPMNHWKKRQEARAGATTEPAADPVPTEQELLMQIRDLLATQGRAEGQPRQ
ncbi:large conductance mechanosensitive channel [Microbacterium sp. AK009]|uniref:large conductance mechanosensitive channel protein MscL n=1 Tax=Microbacterium sp. AK009 TaxID=2723068 RepID=UPI0015C9AE73|nr:large conductance mechanosensitive channel protein MscL [Microbacterium sp. AK009]NYF17480.1 large conductance mechanosensitive channel [Microbacterium sp. AK009]